MQLVFDVPVAADGSGKAACRSFGVSQVVGDLAGAGPQTGPGTAMQHIAADADDLLDQRLPLGADPCLGGFEHLGGPGFVPGTPFCDGGVGVEWSSGGAGRLGLLQQGGLVVL